MPGIQEVRRITGDLEGGKGTALYMSGNTIQEIRENGFGRENIPAMMAAVVVISVPLVVLFLVFRKKVMAGVARGGTKG